MSEPIPEKVSLNQQDDSKYKLKQKIDVVLEGKKPFECSTCLGKFVNKKYVSISSLLIETNFLEKGNMSKTTNFP